VGQPGIGGVGADPAEQAAGLLGAQRDERAGGLDQNRVRV
jgi:hypothetical protein